MKWSLFLLVIFALSVVAADGCSIKNLCFDQDDNPYCSANAESCVFKEFEEVDGSCKLSHIESDTDGDQWSNSCDAFPNNSSEWFDLDGDFVGHNEDCNDLDASVRYECYEEETTPKENETAPVNESNNPFIPPFPEDDGSDNSSNTTGEETDLNETIELPPSSNSTNETNYSSRSGPSRNSNVGEVRLITSQEPAVEPQDDSLSETPRTIISGEEPEQKNLPQNQDEDQDSAPVQLGNQITGLVAGSAASAWSWWVLVVIIVVLFGWLILLARKRKNAS